jgi:hypothetical protein
MPKYYTPPSRIRFANQDAVAFKKMAAAVEVCVNVTSDHCLSEKYYSGVIRFRLDDWKRYTVIWLYGNSVGLNQDFVQPSISDVNSDFYIENPRVVPPSPSSVLTLTGSNFVPGVVVQVGDQYPSNNFVDRNHVVVSLTGWYGEAQNVGVRVIRPDYRSSSIFSDLSFEYRPTVSGVDRTGTFVDGGVQINISGNYFKAGSNVRFVSGTASVWSNNSTLNDQTKIGTFTPALPATGTYTIQVESPSRLSSSINVNSTIQVFHRRPVVTSVLPFNTGSIAGGSNFSIVGSYFLSGAHVYFGASGALSQSRISSGRIDVVSPSHAPAAITVTVTNTEDGQTSVGFPFLYAVPVPTIVDVNFEGDSNFTKKTGSAGSSLFITGTNFTGSDPLTTVTQVSLYSGTFTTVSTNFVINSPTELVFTIPTLITGSHYNIAVSNSAGTGLFLDAFEYQDTPVITSVNPSFGTVAGGLFVFVNGRPFYSGSSQVKFSGVLATQPTISSINQISAISPQAANLDGGYVRVSVQNFGSIEGGLSNAFEYVPFPTASYVRSINGNNRVAAETVSGVTLVGSRFTADRVGVRGTTIQLGGSTSSIITSFIDNTQVLFNVQPHVAGLVDLTATNRGIAAGAPLAAAVEYVNTPTITAISRNAVVLAGGITIAITGTNFINNTDTVVFVGTKQVAAVVADAQHLTFVAPALSANTYRVVVRNREATSSNEMQLQYIRQPTITSVSVNQGSNSGGTLVIVNGTGFLSGSTSASFSGSSVYFTSLSKAYPLVANVIGQEQFSFVTPAAYASSSAQRGFVSLTASVMGYTASLTNSFFYELQPTIASLSTNVALTGGTTVIGLTGSGFVNGLTTLSVDNVGVGYTFVDATHLTFTAPAHASGNWSSESGHVAVKVVNTFLSASVSTLYYAAQYPPVISNIVVGTVTCSINGDAKWNIAEGGALHLQSGGYGDRLVGTRFTNDMNLSIVPFDGSPTLYPAYQFIDSTMIRFTMPAKAQADNLAVSTQGYIVLTNTNGESNYAKMRWNPRAVLTAVGTPSFGRWNSSSLIALTGQGFTSGETFVQLTSSVKMPASVLDNTGYMQIGHLNFTLPSTYNSSIDQTRVEVYPYNSTSMPDEGGQPPSYYHSIFSDPKFPFYTVNPPAIEHIENVDVPIAGGGNAFIVTTEMTHMYPILSPTGVHIYYDYALVDYGQAIGQSTGSLSGAYFTPAPPHAVGTVPLFLGYTNEAGTKFIGSGRSINYYIPQPIVMSMTGTLTQNGIMIGGGWRGNVVVQTSPWLYVSVSGGVQPYDISVQRGNNQSVAGAPILPVEYNQSNGMTSRAFRWNGNVNYNTSYMSCSAAYRWKIVDAVGTTVYSPFALTASYFISD